MPNQRINLDHSSTTPRLPEVKQAVAAALEQGGNPSSMHQDGQRAKRALEQARKQVATLISAKPDEVYFTSCGTESNNWALRGLFSANRRKGNHIVISAIEHPSVSLVARRLELDGAVQATILPVDRDGMVSPEELRKAMRPETVLVSVMLANGEVGTIQHIQHLAAIAHEQECLFHTDAVAAVGHIAVDVKALGVDALSLAANQFYGPQGAAALCVREGVRILPLIEGGGQERGGRSGTEAVPAIAGMGVAAEIAARDLAGCITALSRLRDRLQEGLSAGIERLRVNGSRTSRLPHNLHVCIDGVSSESLVLGLDHAGIAVGLGSACNSKAMRPSHVLKAMGLSDDESKGALVMTVGVTTTDADIDRALELIPQVVDRLRRVTLMTVRGS